MYRRHSPRDVAVRKARRSLALRLGLEPRQHYRKHHPLDCGVTRCGTCHPDKHAGVRRETRQELHARLRCEEALLDEFTP